MYAAMGPATLVRIQLCAYLVSSAPQLTFIPWRRRWQPILRSRDLCWRWIIAVTDCPNTIAIPKTTRFEAQLTKLAPQDWVAFAQRTWREGHGTLVPSHDPKLARALRGFSLERLPT